MKQPSGATFIALGRLQTLLQGLGGYTRGFADTPPRRKLHTFEDQNLLQVWHPPIHFWSSSPRRRMGLHCSLQTKITNGYRLKAVEKYKHIATCVAIFPVLGRSERRRKALSPWLARRPGCEGCEEQPPDRTGPAGCSPRKLSSSISSTEDHAGGRAGGQHPPHRLPESNLVAGGDDAKNSRQTWRHHHGQASPPPSG